MNYKVPIVIFYLLVNTLGLYFIKVFFNSAKPGTIFSFASLANPKLIFGAILYVAGFLTWMWLLSKSELSTIYPIIIGLSYVAVLAVSFLVLKEHLSIYKISGALLILIGLLLISRVSK